MRERLILLAAALAAFGASLGSGFHFDDYAIFSDPALTSSGGWLAVWGLHQTRPLTYFTYWLNFQLGGRNPLGYHAVNLLLHLAAVLLAYECLRRLLPTASALFAAALFAVHPIQAESVDYIWGRPMLLASVLCFAALLAWLAGKPWVALAAFAAALLAKEECAAFPLVFALLWMRTPPPRPRRDLWAIAAMLLLALAAGLRVIYVLAITPGAPAGARAGIPPLNYLLAQAVAIPRYLQLLIVPAGFTIDPEITVPPVWHGVLIWAAILALALFAWHRRATWGIWLLAAMILLIPSSTIFPAADLAADRRMYLPLFFLAASVAALPGRPPLRVLAVAPVVLFLAVSISRTQVWNSDASLWAEAVERAPSKIRPRIQLSRSVPRDEGLRLLADARRLAPNDPAVAAETGRILLDSGNAAAALPEFGRALALDPRDAYNYNNRGVALAALGQTEAARLDFTRALQLDPSLTSAADNLRKLGAR